VWGGAVDGRRDGVLFKTLKMRFKKWRTKHHTFKKGSSPLRRGGCGYWATGGDKRKKFK
jgi:hypothetical protein